MKSGIHILLLVYAFALVACNNQDTHDDDHHEHEHEEGVIEISNAQYEALGMKVDTLAKRNMNGYVQTNGELILPPQSEASITSMIGANVTDIKVIEGDKVRKGQVLAYMKHPDIIKLQTEYVKMSNDFDYTDKEYQRRKKLYEKEVSSGKEYQEIRAKYLSLKAEVSGMESQLRILGLNPENVKQGDLYTNVPLSSPIGGNIREVNVRIGQYVNPNERLFAVVNNNHIHGHFMVYEKDVMKVKKGQKVLFSVEALDGAEFEAEIISVGKVFESSPKAIQVHAEIENEDGRLISGLYLRGRIIVENSLNLALPEEALVREGAKSYVFKAMKEEGAWDFVAIEVKEGNAVDGWIEISLMEKLDKNEKFAWNNAYYLFSEWKKEEAGHDH